MTVVAARWQRAEGLALLVAALVAYGQIGQGWVLFGLLFLAPDLSFFGYLAGPRVGSVVYNLAHSLVGPLLLGVARLIAGHELSLGLALIWTAHIGFDRLVGYGLKSRVAFGVTHLGLIGKARRSEGADV